MKKEIEKQRSASNDFFYKLSLKSSFKKDLLDFRAKYGIEKDGYDVQNSKDGYFHEMAFFFLNKKESDKQHNQDIKVLADKYNVPANLFFDFKLFLIIDHTSQSYIERTSRLPEKRYGFELSSEDSSTEGEWRKTGRPFVKLLISENWTVNGLVMFLKQHEKIIKGFLDKNKQLNDKRDRETVNLFRDDLIYNLWRTPIEDLREMSKKQYPDKYKEDAISTILKNEYGLKVKPATVKKTAERQVKLRDN